MRTMTRVILLILACLAVPVASSAQALGTIAGVVKDTSGAVLPGTTVEVASPALIEKVRSVVTDGAGQYRIVNLPPGVYSVSFTLTGFSGVKRDGIEVTANFTSSVNGDLKVGAVAETITVSAESPIVDVQSATQTRALTAEAFKNIPTSGVWIQLATLIPAVQTATRDVGGSSGDTTGAQVTAHGALAGDGVSLLDGLRVGNMYISSNVSNMSFSPLLFDQVDISISGQTGESGTNGVVANMIPKAGGNSFRGSVLGNGSGPSLQASNITQRLVGRGLAGAPTSLKKLYDVNGAIGGPVKKDSLWFYFTSRYFTNESYIAGLFYPNNSAAVVRTEDTGHQANSGTWTRDNNLRLTWAMSQKSKLSVWYAYQRKQDPSWAINATVSPEAARVTDWYTQLGTLTWTYAATNRLLFEVGASPGASPDTILAQLDRSAGIPIVEQGTGINPLAKPMTYRASTASNMYDNVRQQSYRASATYVTGTHSVKVGMDLQRGHFNRNNFANTYNDIQIRTRDFVPNQVTIFAPLAGFTSRLNNNLGLYAQDRWTLKRVTIGGGLRFDFQNESVDAFTANTTRWTPNRTNAYAEVPNVPNWKDVNPRVNVAYDLFGNGKTALKASASRGVEQDSIRYADANNPGNTVSTTTSRTWTDSNGNFFPDCNLLNSATQDNRATGGDVCGGWLNLNFGNFIPSTRYDGAIMNGWGIRPWNWEFSTSVQHEVMPRLSANVGYFRRVQGNFFVTDNEALGPSDFLPYSITVPTDSRLPNAGGTITGLYDQRAPVVNRNVVKAASQFGNQYQHWNGMDAGIDARLRNGVFLQAGLSTGTTMTDNCEVAAKVDNPSQLYCHTETGFVTQYKGLGSYTLPWGGVRLSATFQSLFGPQVAANVTYTNADIAAGRVQGLGRATFNAAQAATNVIEPGTIFGDRLNQIDFRVTKIITVGRGRIEANLDLYNLGNSDAIILQNNVFGATWTRPTSVIQPRFVKFTVRYDF
ncbi:MAG: TonB-dependent receptor [Phycisphaerales bacterium]|nr:TonB-dependent receptor [Phycisphaerales bacterium]